MWVCVTHMKEALTLLEAPHIRKASLQIKCSFCENRAFAKIYFGHHIYPFSKRQKLYSSIRDNVQKSG